MKPRICVVSLLFLVQTIALAQSCSNVGTAYLNNIINWSQTPDLSFTVAGGQPNVCGHFTSTRNGQSYDYGWVACTDASGNAIMGPYTWASRTADQTDTNLLVTWPNCNYTTFTTNHYWDITCPKPTITSPNGAPPSQFYGTGHDGIWGAGFGSWTSVKVQFKDNSTGLYWNGTDYTASTPPDINAAITSGLGTIGPTTADSPSYDMTWKVEPVPDNHQIFHSYTWTVVLKDGDIRCQEQPETPITFRITCTPSINEPCTP